MGYSNMGWKPTSPRRGFENHPNLLANRSLLRGVKEDFGRFGVYGGSWNTNSGNVIVRGLKHALLLASAGVLLHVLVLDPLSARYKRSQFEQILFSNWLNHHRQLINPLLQLAREQNNPYKFDLQPDGLHLCVVKSSDFVYQGTFHGGDAVVNLFYERDHGYQHFAVENGTLYVDRRDKRYYVLNNWAVIYASLESNVEMQSEVLALFHWDSAKLDAIIQQMQLLGIAEVMIDSKRILRIKLNATSFGTYWVLVSNSPLKFPEHLKYTRLSDQAIWYHEKVR
ncbi:MAG: hypothetical protein U0289_01765 [Cyclobacteriaceae bacterium]|nr:hypothetical protein [Cyclobacteriaceae bacterium]